MLGNRALADVAGPLKDFAEKLGGPNGDIWLVAFKRFLRKEKTWSKFPIWRTIKLGAGPRTAEAFRLTFNASGFHTTGPVDDALNKLYFLEFAKGTDIALVVISGRGLGFEGDAYRVDIYHQARVHGLAPCPAVVGPELRWQYRDQSEGEELLIGMEPIEDIEDTPCLFSVAHTGNGLWLHGINGNPALLYSPDTLWVFCYP